MSLDTITSYFTQYGAIAIFVIVLLEYMNLPGFPAGVIMPLSGVMAARGNISFAGVMIITLLAGVAGSWILYAVGYAGGSVILEKYLEKFPKHRPAVERNFALIRKRGCVGIFIGKLIPMVRTIISIPAGVLKMPLRQYLISSLAGVFLWNLVFVGAGYLGGEAILQYLI